MVLLIALLIYGFLFDNTKEKYSDISQNYEKMRPTDEKKPHRYFDIRTEDWLKSYLSSF